MSNTLELSVILPAYCEEENLRLLLPRLKNVLDGLTQKYEILILDTLEPMDKTALVCQENDVRYIPREGGNAFGDAVRTGIKYALGKYILFMDADGSHTPEYIPELYVHRRGNGIVIASRYISGGATENSFLLSLMSRVLNITYRLILGLKCNDVSNSFKLYDANLLRPIILRCDNFDIIEELLFKISRANRKLFIKEVPFTFKKRMFGETKRKLVLFILTYFWTIAKLRMSVLFPFTRRRLKGRATG